MMTHIFSLSLCLLFTLCVGIKFLVPGKVTLKQLIRISFEQIISYILMKKNKYFLNCSDKISAWHLHS